MNDDVLLRIKDLKTQLGEGINAVRAVDGVSFAIRRGETFALLGESGCGKSMTALSLMRLLPAAGHIVSGSVICDGTDLLKLPEIEMRQWRGGRIGMIFQEPMTSLNAVMTIGEQLNESVRTHQAAARSEIRIRVLELLDSVGISDPERRVGDYPHQLSGGMKQRVMIAMALAGNPDLLIADEPTTAVDVTIQAQVLELLKNLQHKTAMAILLITHDLGVVAQVADRVAVMYAGQIVEQAPIVPFFKSPHHPYSQRLFGAIPDMRKRGHPLAAIPGAVPSLGQRFHGCRFASRCDRVIEPCHDKVPHWVELTESRCVRCFLYRDDVTRQTRVSTFKSYAKQWRQPQKNFKKKKFVEIKNLRVYFPIQKGVFKRTVGHVRAVDDVSLSLQQGHTLALVGESGCGKTSLGRAILRLIPIAGGTIYFEGTDLIRLRGRKLIDQRARMQIIFQDPFSSMNPRMMIGEIIEEGMSAQHIGESAAWRRRRVAQLLEQVGLSADVSTHYPHEFSGGQRQRICIARVLAVNPQFIVCDEPTSALDVSVQAQILNLLGELQNRLALTYLLITHDISVVAYMAHEVAVMYLGRIVEKGLVHEVLNEPQHPYTQALLSAVPQIEPEKGTKVIRLRGEIPSATHPPSGCYFHPRCSKAIDRCRVNYPEAVKITDTHVVNCVLAGQKE